MATSKEKNVAVNRRKKGVRAGLPADCFMYYLSGGVRTDAKPGFKGYQQEIKICGSKGYQMIYVWYDMMPSDNTG